MGDLGLRVIEALRLVQNPTSTERALNELKRQLAAARGRAVDLHLRRTDAAMIERAAEIAIKVREAEGLEVPSGAGEALDELRDAIR